MLGQELHSAVLSQPWADVTMLGGGPDNYVRWMRLAPSHVHYLINYTLLENCMKKLKCSPAFGGEFDQMIKEIKR